MNLKDISLEPIGKLVASDFHNLPWYHFSIDDVFDSLIEVTVKNIPLFKHPFFSLMKEVHDKYGTQVDLELFWEREIDGTLYTLADVRDLKEEPVAISASLRDLSFPTQSNSARHSF